MPEIVSGIVAIALMFFLFDGTEMVVRIFKALREPARLRAEAELLRERRMSGLVDTVEDADVDQG